MSTATSHFLFQPSKFRVPHMLKIPLFATRCTKLNSDQVNNSTPELKAETGATAINPEQQPQMDRMELEKRRKFDLLNRPRSSELAKPEPPNFEIGWKRTKEIQLEQPKGYFIADFLEKLEGLMSQRLYGSTELLAKAGAIVAERAREEAEVLREEGQVDERLVTELARVLRLMEMDLEMVKAAVKEETLAERLDVAVARCRQAILVASSF